MLRESGASRCYGGVAAARVRILWRRDYAKEPLYVATI
jgi:hypothetical protein